MIFITESAAFADLYIVRKGDSLYKIAKRFHTTISKIKRLNGLRSSRLFPGQRLIVPGRKHKPVRSGEAIKFVEARLETDSVKVDEEAYPLTATVQEEGERLDELLSVPFDVPYDNWSLSILENREYRSAFLSALVKVLKKLKNTPYAFGESKPGSGMDCSSFTMYVYRQLGVELPRTARAQYRVGVPVTKPELKPGDLVFFRTYARFPSHVGIYIGDGKFLHFSSMFHGLAVSSLNRGFFKRRYVGARRVLSEKLLKRIAMSGN